jgi:hypothetical protein
MNRIFFPKRLLPGNAAERPAWKGFLVSAATVRRKNGKPRHFLMEFAEPGHDLVGEHHVIVAVLEDEWLADSLFETAHVIDGIAGDRFTKMPTLPGVCLRKGKTTTEPSL